MNKISSSWDSFSKNRLSVITYNYDRSLETFLVEDLKHTYKKPIVECINKIQETITIKHVHGIIADVPIGENKPYESQVMSLDLDNAIKKLHIITEEDEVRSAYNDVHKILDFLYNSNA